MTVDNLVKKVLNAVSSVAPGLKAVEERLAKLEAAQAEALDLLRQLRPPAVPAAQPQARRGA